MLTTRGTSGTDGKCDCSVSVDPSEIFSLEYSGSNSKLYRQRTESIVKDTLGRYGIDNAKVAIEDKGAIQLVIKARLESAIERALDGGKS